MSTMTEGGGEVKVSDFSDRAVRMVDLIAAFSPERMSTYQAATAGNHDKAAQLYVWNVKVSAAFYGPLQAVEVMLRNAMHRELSRCYGLHWYDEPRAGLDWSCSSRIGREKNHLTNIGHRITPSRLVAALPFGFWVSLLGAGGRIDRESHHRKANYEMTLWRPAIRLAFPHGPRLSRKAAHAPLDYLRTLRNRIAHHEPIFNRHLAKDYERILEVAEWLSPPIRTWIERHSRLPALLEDPKDDPDVCF